MIIPLDMKDPLTASRVWRLQHAAYAVEAQIIGNPNLPPLMDTVRSLQQCGEIFYGIYKQEELTAAVSYQNSDRHVRICRMMVDPAHFRQGLARRLLVFVENRIPQALTFSVSTGSANLPAVNLYRQAGYEAASEWEVAPGLHLIQFMKRGECR